MRGDVHVYSPKNIIAAFGSHMPSGWAEDSFITITEQGDGVTDTAGADGEVVVSISDDPRFEVKVVFSYGSATNNYLLNMYNRNKQVPGSGFFNILIRDLGDNPKFQASTAWVSKGAPIVYGKTASTQEWTIRCVGKLEPQS